MLGCLKQTQWAHAGYPSLTIDQYLEYRRGSVGALPAFILVEYGSHYIPYMDKFWLTLTRGAMNVTLPRDITEHPAIAACEEAMVDVVIMSVGL